MSLSVTNLCHQPVCVRVLLVLKDDVRVVVRSQVLEALRAAADLPLVLAAGSQGFLCHVGDVLLESQRRQLVVPALAVPPARSAARDDGRQQQAQGHRQHHSHQDHLWLSGRIQGR